MKYNINNYKKKIIRIVSQKIKINYKEPYKLEEASRSVCSGFFIKDNYIITCSHCIDHSKDIYIEIPDEGKRKYKVDIVGLCPHLDIALLKSIEYKSKEYFTLGDSDKLLSGQEVVAIGFPLAQNAVKMTRGIISGRQNGKIQTDTPVNPGNSGGPLIYNNNVIGIVSSGVTKSSNVGYAVPINKYNTIKKELYDKKQLLILRTKMNTIFNYNNTDANLLALYGAKSGVFINDTNNKSVGGLQKGDILVSINKNKIDSYGYIKSKKLNEKMEVDQLLDYIKQGDKIEIEYVRNKKSHKQSFIYKYNNFPIREIYPRFEKFDYEVINGLVLTQLSLNYMKSLYNEDNHDLNKSLYKYYYYKNRKNHKIIISFIYPNTSISNIDVLEEGQIVTKCNGIEVETIEDLRKAAIKYTMIKKKKYILLETDFNENVIIDVKEYIERGNNNRNTFMYPVTPLYNTITS